MAGWGERTHKMGIKIVAPTKGAPPPPPPVVTAFPSFRNPPPTALPSPALNQ